MNNLITIATFPLPQNAYIIKARLESEGIPVFLKDELTVQSDNFLSIPLGGVKMQVSKENAQKAKDIVVESGIPQSDPVQLLNPFSKNSILTAGIGLLAILIIIALLWFSGSFNF